MSSKNISRTQNKIKENIMKKYTFDINGSTFNVVINSVSGDTANVTVNGVNYHVGIRNNAIADVQEYVQTASAAPAVQAAPVQAQAAPAAPAASGNAKTVKAPLPGVVIAVKVNVGDAVKPGQTVAVLEAMKMENDILAECAGTVTAINVNQGDSILEGAPIVTIQ